MNRADPVRVVLLVTDLQRGGTPLRLAGLARGLQAAGVDVHVGCLAPAGPVSDELAADGIPTFACRARGPRDLGALLRLLRHLRRIRPDLVHSTLVHANLAARFVGGYLGIPVVTSTATIEVERRWHRTVERWTGGFDRGHIVGSPALAEHVTHAFGVPAERVHVVPPFLDPLPQRLDRDQCRRGLHIPVDVFLVAWAGRFDPVKRLDIVVECARLLPGALFLLAGDGPQRPALEQQVRTLGLQERVRLPGWTSDLVPLLSAADAFLFPSLTEGMPNAVLQAMACELPIVGSAIPALRALADDNRRLLLVDSEQAAGYAAALTRLRDDAALRTALASAAGQWARENLDRSRTIAALLDAYRSAQMRA